MWWKVDSDVPLDDVVKEIRDVLQFKALPFLERFDSLAECHRFLASVGGWQREYPLQKLYRAALSYLLGERQESKHLIQDVLSGPKAWVSKAEAMASKVDADKSPCR